MKSIYTDVKEIVSDIQDGSTLMVGVWVMWYSRALYTRFSRIRCEGLNDNK